MAELDMDATRKQRIKTWLPTQWVPTSNEEGLEKLLLDFWKFLDECEVERQRE